MDLIKAANMLKGLSDQQLLMESHNPSPQIPAYATLAEMERRKTTRAAFQGQVNQAQMKPVEQQLQQQLAQGTPPAAPQAGIGSLPPQDPAGRSQTPVPAMRSGGVVRAAAGIQETDDVSDPGTEDNPEMTPMDQQGQPGIGALPAVPAGAPAQGLPMSPAYSAPDLPEDIPSRIAAIKSRGTTLDWQKYEAQLQKRISELEAKKVRPGDILIQLGLGTAASGARSLPQALAHGGLQAFGYYQHEDDSKRKDLRSLAQEQFTLARLQNQDNSTIEREARDGYAADMRARAAEVAAQHSDGRTQLRLQAEAELQRQKALTHRTEMDAIEQRMKDRASQKTVDAIKIKSTIPGKNPSIAGGPRSRPLTGSQIEAMKGNELAAIAQSYAQQHIASNKLENVTSDSLARQNIRERDANGDYKYFPEYTEAQRQAAQDKLSRPASIKAAAADAGIKPANVRSRIPDKPAKSSDSIPNPNLYN